MNQAAARLPGWLPLAGREGVCLFETGVPGESALNILAVSPSGVLTGNIFEPDDRRRIRRVLEMQRASTPPPDAGVPGAGLYGWIRYDGGFVLGRYDRVKTRTGVRTKDRPVSDWSGVVLKSHTSAAQYRDMVRRAISYIQAGDIYQVNLARRFEGTLEPGQRSAAWRKRLYQNLRRESPVPFASLTTLQGSSLLAATPELFLRMEGNQIETRPIKGTQPRSHLPLREEMERVQLLSSEKERAELLMITDLERNDLGRSCRFGSVRVRDLAVIESYAHLHHMVSRVTGELRPDTDHVEALAAAFPGGSITGAPKIRAQEIIAELEGFDRGAYTGAIGWFGAHGFSQFSIAIRTLEIQGDRLLLHAGAGIVADSDPGREARETMIKARALFAAAGAEWDVDG